LVKRPFGASVNRQKDIVMKEENGDQGVGATAFDMPNSQHPGYENKIYHTDKRVPHPTNAAAKRVDGPKVMRQVMDGK